MAGHARSRVALSALALLATLAIAGCPRGSGGGGGAGSGAINTASSPDERDKAKAVPVATIGKRKITLGQLERAINRQNRFVRMRYTSMVQRKRFLTSMIRLEVLAAEARKRNLHKHPNVIRRAKRLLAEQLMRTLEKTLVKFDQIADADAKAYYDKHKARYQQPAKVRVSMIVTKTKPEADKVLALAKKKRTDTRYFAKLVIEHSVDPASKVQRGNLGFFTESTDKYPKEVVKAAFAIKGLWGFSEPFKTKKGWAVLLRTGERPRVNRPFSIEKGRIKNRLFHMRRFKAVQGYVKKLHKDVNIKVDEKNLAKVKIKTPKTTRFKLPKHAPGHKH